MPKEQPLQPRRRGEVVRRAVLDAAAAELSAADGHEVTVAGIAVRAGVHETSIYRRWVTKEALLLEAAHEQTMGAVPKPDTGSFRGDLVALVLAIDSFLDSPSGAALFRLAHATSTSSDATARTMFWLELVRDRAVIVDRARAKGEVRPDVNFDLLLRALVGPVHMRAIFGGEPFTRRYAEDLVELLLVGAEIPATVS